MPRSPRSWCSKQQGASSWRPRRAFSRTTSKPAVVARNLDLVRRTGTAVVVLPSDVDGDSAELIARRQAQRYPQESYEHWLAVTTKRPPINRALADVEVIARGSPEEVAALTFARLGAAGVLERR